MGVYPGGAFQEEDEEDPDVKRMKARRRCLTHSQSSHIILRRQPPFFG